jgi:hypothetical protein
MFSERRLHSMRVQKVARMNQTRPGLPHREVAQQHLILTRRYIIVF